MLCFVGVVSLPGEAITTLSTLQRDPGSHGKAGKEAYTREMVTWVGW